MRCRWETMCHPSGSTSASTSTWLCLLVLCTGLVHTTALTLTPDQFLMGQSFYYYEYSPHSFSSLFSSESSPVLYVKFNTTTSMWRSTHDMYVRIMDFGLFEPAQGDTLVYEVYWNTNLNAAIALDIRTNDKLGTKSFANVEPAPQDQNHLSARVGTDLRPHATTQWYRRQIPIPATMMNRGGISFWVGCARRESGIYSAQFRSISIVNLITGKHTSIYGDSSWQAISMLTCIIIMVIVALLVFLIVCRQRRMQSAIKKWQTTESSDSTSSSSSPSSARRDPQSYSLLVDADDNASPSNARTVTTSPSQSPSQSPSSPSSASRVRDRRTFQAEFMDQRFCCIRPPKCLSPDSCWVPLVSWSMLLPTLSVLLFFSLGLTIAASAFDSWVILDQNVSITFGVVEIRSALPSYPVGSFNYSCNGLTCTIVRFAGLVVLILQIISAFLLSCVLLSMLRSRYQRWRLTEQQRHLPATYLQYQHHISNVTCMITVAFLCMGVTVCVAALGMFWPMVQDVTNVLHSIDHGINQFPTLMWGNYILLGVSWVIQCVPMGILLFVTPMMHIYHRWVLTVTIKQREQWHAQQIQRQYLQRRFAFWLHSPAANVNTHHPEQQMIQIQPRTSSDLPGIAIDANAAPIVIPQPGSESVVSVAEAATVAHTIRRLSGSQGPATVTPTNAAAMTRTMRSVSTSSTVAYMTQLYQKAPYQQVSIPETTPLTAAVQAPRVTSVSIAASTPVERQLAMQAAPAPAPSLALRTSPSPYPLPLSPSSLIADMPTLTLARVRSISQPFSLRTGLPPPPVSSRRASAIFELSQPLLSTSTLIPQQHVVDSTRYSRTDHRQREEGDEADD